jgi:hypothetical protein
MALSIQAKRPPAIPTVYARIFILLLRLHAEESGRACDPQTGEQEWAWWYMAEGGHGALKGTTTLY